MKSLSVCALLVTLGAVGCSQPPDAARVLDTVRSWTATAHFAAEDLRSGATSATYTVQIRDKARSALTEAMKDLATHPTSADTARQARSATDSLAAALRLLDAELAAR